MPALVLAAVAVVVLVDRDVHEVSASDRGSLTPEQYVAAVGIARKEMAQEDATVTAAVAEVVGGRDQTSVTTYGCGPGDRQLVVELVGDFPHIANGGLPEGSVTGPDNWVTIRTDATTGEVCRSGVSLGHFSAPPGSADLMPAL